MNREEFMRQLDLLLKDISDEEKQEALEFYNNYFEDAGEENEARIIQELGSPGKVAAIIKADLQSGSDDFVEYTEQGYRDSRMQEDRVPQVYGSEDRREKRKRERDRSERGYQAPPKKNNTGNMILIIAVIVLSCWLWGPLLLGIGGTLFGLLVALAAVVLCMGIGGLAGIICGVVFAVSGVIKCFGNPGLGLLEIAAGFGCLVVGILMILLFLWVAIKLFPWIIRKIAGLCQKLLNRSRKRGVEA